jgi:myo-inositol 2-dehydrogenase/D-chiro-inositol 1-dehydrogenase
MTIGVGLIGAGVMGADHARTLLTAVSGAELVAVSIPTPGKWRKSSRCANSAPLRT